MECLLCLVRAGDYPALQPDDCSLALRVMAHPLTALTLIVDAEKKVPDECVSSCSV